LTWAYLLPVYLKELGASDLFIGISYSAYAIGFCLFQLIGGHLADKFRKKRLIIIIQGIYPFLFLLMSITRSYYLLSFIYFIYALLTSLQFPILTGLLANSVPKNDFGNTFARYQANLIIGFSLGPLLGYFLLKKGLTIQNLFTITAFFASIAFLISLFGVLDENYLSVKKNISDKKRFKMPKKLFPLLIAGIFFYVLLQFTFFGPFPTMFMNEIENLTPIKINLLFAIGGGFGGLFLLLIGNKITPKRGLLQFFFSQTFHFIFIFLWVIFKIDIFFIIGWMAIQPSMVAINVLLAAESHEKNRGKVFGYFGTLTGIIPAIAPPLLIYLKNSFGYPFIFLLPFPIIIIQILLFKKSKVKASE
jgi:MFS family permease